MLTKNSLSFYVHYSILMKLFIRNNAPTVAIKCDYCQPMSEVKWPELENKDDNENVTNHIDLSSDGKLVTESHPLKAPPIALSNEQFEDNIGHHRIDEKMNDDDGLKFVSKKNTTIAKWRLPNDFNGSDIINNDPSNFNILLRPGRNNKGKIIYKSSASFVIFADDDDDDNEPNNDYVDKMNNKQVNIDVSTSSNASINDDLVRNKINASLLVNSDNKSDMNASPNEQQVDKISNENIWIKLNGKDGKNVDHVNNDDLNNYQWPSKDDYHFANETSNSVPNGQYEKFNCANSNNDDCINDENNVELNEDVHSNLPNFGNSHSHKENVFGKTKNETSYSKVSPLLIYSHQTDKTFFLLLN